jgi:cell wall-associated NlpC family hydrolase
VVSAKGLVDTADYEEAVGPASFAVTGNTVYLDDARKVQGSVRTYLSGRYRGAIGLDGVATIDLQASGNELTILDNADTIRTYTVMSATKAALTATRTLSPGTESFGTATVSKEAARTTGLTAGSADELTVPVTTDSIASIDGALVARLSDDSTVRLSGVAAATSGSPAETFRPVAGGFDVVDAGGAVVKQIRVPYNPETVELLYRGGGYDYYFVCDSYSNTRDEGVFNGYVFRFAADGAAAGVYTLKGSDYSSSREVQIADGQVYQLRGVGTTAEVLRLAPDTGTFTVAKDFKELTSYPSAPVGTSAPATHSAPSPRSSPVTTQSITPVRVTLSNVEVGSEYQATYTWTYSKAKNGKAKKSWGAKVKAPQQIARLKTPTATFHGIPYTWGGWDTTTGTSSSKGWKNFPTGLKKGEYVGNVTSKSPTWVPGTIGVDCSGFVSAMFDLPSKHGTGNLRGTKYFAAVSGFHPQAGDILVRAGDHVVIYFGKAANGKWLIGESINGIGKSDQVQLWKQKPKRFLGYRVARYRNLDLED